MCVMPPETGENFRYTYFYGMQGRSVTAISCVSQHIHSKSSWILYFAAP